MLLLHALIASAHSAWTAKAFYDSQYAHNSSQRVFDPDGLLSAAAAAKIRAVIDDTPVIAVRLILLGAIDAQYVDYYAKSPSVEAFLTELLGRVFPREEDVFLALLAAPKQLALRPGERALSRVAAFCPAACAAFGDPLDVGLLAVVEELRANAKRAGPSRWQAMAITLGVVFGALILVVLVGVPLALGCALRQ